MGNARILLIFFLQKASLKSYFGNCQPAVSVMIRHTFHLPSVLNGYVAGGLPEVLEQGTVLTYNCDPGYQVETHILKLFSIITIISV